MRTQWVLGGKVTPQKYVEFIFHSSSSPIAAGLEVVRTLSSLLRARVTEIFSGVCHAIDILLVICSVHSSFPFLNLFARLGCAMTESLNSWKDGFWQQVARRLHFVKGHADARFCPRFSAECRHLYACSPDPISA